MSKLYFDHCFTLDQNHRLLKKLERLGFTLRPTATEHPGGHVCRFIMFKGKVRNQYLEFVHTRPGGDAYSHPGISFGYKGPLERYFKRIKKTLPSEFVHRNYDWKADSKTRLPGWNFLTFKHLGFRTLLPWLTEYEPFKRKRAPYRAHKNGCDKIIGLEVEINEAGRRFFAKLKPGRLVCGTQLKLVPGSRTTLRRVIIRNRNLTRFARRYRLPITKYDGKPCVQISNPAGLWDLVIL